MMEDAARLVRDLMQGASTATGSVSLATGAATSTVVDLSDRRIGGVNCHVTLTPTNANAAAEVGNGTLYAVMTRGTLTVHHSASANARSFTYEIRTPYGRT